MIHNCKNIIFHCMDFRLADKIRSWMAENGLLGDCDTVSIAGAGKSLVSGDEAVKDFLLKQINISRDLHGAVRVIMLHHSDCGAYKSAYNFSSDREEEQRHKEDMAKAEKIIKNRFPEMEVLKIWVEMKDPAGKNVIFHAC